MLLKQEVLMSLYVKALKLAVPNIVKTLEETAFKTLKGYDEPIPTIHSSIPLR